MRKLIPQLQVLDEMPATQTGLSTGRTLDQDWLLVKAAIREGSVLDGLLPRPGRQPCPPPPGLTKGCPRRGPHPGLP